RKSDGLAAALAELTLRGSRTAFVSAAAFGDTEGDATKTALFVYPTSTASLYADEAKLTAKLKQLYPNDTPELVAQPVHAILPLDQAVVAANKESDTKYHPIGKDGLAATVPHVDWDVYLAHLGIPNAKRIVVENISGLSKIDAAIAAASEESMAMYIDFKYAD